MNGIMFQTPSASASASASDIGSVSENTGGNSNISRRQKTLKPQTVTLDQYIAGQRKGLQVPSTATNSSTNSLVLHFLQFLARGFNMLD